MNKVANLWKPDLASNARLNCRWKLEDFIVYWNILCTRQHLWSLFLFINSNCIVVGLDRWSTGQCLSQEFHFVQHTTTPPTLHQCTALNWTSCKYCIRIRTRGGMYGKIWPEPERLLRPYFTEYPDLSPNTDIIPFLTMIYWVLFIRKQLKDQYNTHIWVISESESPLGRL